METERLTHSFGNDEDSKFEIVNKPLHEMNLKTQVQVTSLVKREPLMKAVGKTVKVEFQPGPLGLQLADVGRRVLVTALEKLPTGEPGQAERSGLVEVGFQVVGVAGKSTLGLPMRNLLKLIEQSSRPLLVEFQPLIIPRYPQKGQETIFDRLGESGFLEECGEEYMVEFEQKTLGLNVGTVGKMVVVSQFLSGVADEVTNRISLGDRVSYVESNKRKDSVVEGTWERVDCKRLDYAEVAGLVREAGRPVRIGFIPTKVVIPKTFSTKREASQGKRIIAKAACSSCGTNGPLRAKFCWKCGAVMPGKKQDVLSSDLLGLHEQQQQLEENPTSQKPPSPPSQLEYHNQERENGKEKSSHARSNDLVFDDAEDDELFSAFQ